MSNQNLDLVNIFSTVTKALGQNQQALNEADEYNHDHGDHMVDTFQTITGAMQEKQGGSASDMLSYAAQVLGQSASSGSGKLYAEGLQNAATQFQGQNIDPQMAMTLLQTLIGGGQAAPQQPQQTQQQSGGLLGSLLGSLTGGGQGQQQGGLSDGLDLGDLVTAGMAFMQSKQSGDSNLEAIIDAVTAASGMGSQPYRQQSTQLVANTFMQAISGMGK